MPFLGFWDRASPSQGQCIVFRISAPKPGENTWRNEGLGVISLKLVRSARLTRLCRCGLLLSHQQFSKLLNLLSLPIYQLSVRDSAEMSTEAIPLMSLKGAKHHNNDLHIKHRVKSWTLETWRFTVASGALAAVVIMLINIITLAVVCAKYPMENNQVSFFVGSCDTTRTVTIIAHLIINILSTILLAYSNYSMQCMNSPTRNEVDAAHSKQKWLNIGTPSIRNLFLVSKSKTLLWLILGLTSFPLHMLWNSTVFETKSIQQYITVAVTEEFLHGEHWAFPGSYAGYDVKNNELIDGLQQQAVAGSLDRLDVKSCSDAYGTNTVSDRKHLLLVLDDPESNNSVIDIFDLFSSGRGVAGTETTNLGGLKGFPLCGKGDCSGWTAPIFGDSRELQVRECFSQKVPPQCKINLVPSLLAVIIACNVIKGMCFLLALRITRKDTPLCTTGDMIQSFLKEPDAHVSGRCLVSKRDFERRSQSQEWTSRPISTGDVWTGGRSRWFTAANRWQAGIFMFSLACIAIVVAALLSIQKEGSMEPESEVPTEMDLLNISVPDMSLRVAGSGILAAFIITNIPQVLISYIYLGLNNMLTTMLVMAEWCGYTATSENPPKGLRVSSPLPQTQQRSTYFLSLPYKWSIPTSITVTIIHWLVSQGLLFLQFDVHTSGWEEPSTVHTTSYIFLAKATVWFVIVPVLLASLIALFCLGVFKKYAPHMPLAGCCSASIAAACQPSCLGCDASESNRSFPSDLAEKKLKWGVVESPEQSEFGIGHATFSADDVPPLEEETMYI